MRIGNRERGARDGAASQERIGNVRNELFIVYLLAARTILRDVPMVLTAHAPNANVLVEETPSLRSRRRVAVPGKGFGDRSVVCRSVQALTAGVEEAAIPSKLFLLHELVVLHKRRMEERWSRKNQVARGAPG